MTDTAALIQARAAGLDQAADHIVRFCPEHGSEDETRMDCACEIAEEIREIAADIARLAGQKG